jgi:hypothetical protein
VGSSDLPQPKPFNCCQQAKLLIESMFHGWDRISNEKTLFSATHRLAFAPTLSFRWNADPELAPAKHALDRCENPKLDEKSVSPSAHAVPDKISRRRPCHGSCLEPEHFS